MSVSLVLSRLARMTGLSLSKRKVLNLGRIDLSTERIGLSTGRIVLNLERIVLSTGRKSVHPSSRGPTPRGRLLHPLPLLGLGLD